ncbi:MAG: hypothetical protein AAF410_02025 [Pseudomonadota bacterium]
MTAYELVDLATSIGGRLDLQISLFVTIHLALFGGIFYLDRSLNRTEQIFTLLVYSIFAALSYYMMLHQAAMISAIYNDAVKYLSDDCCSASEVLARMARELEAGRNTYMRVVIISIHAFLYLAVVMTILFDGRRK